MIRHQLVLAITLAGLSLSPAVVQANPDEVKTEATQQITFSISAQPLDAALTQFGRQAKLQLSYQPNMTKGKTSTPVTGNYSVKQALTLLLSNTGIRARFIDSNSVVLEEINQRSVGAIRIEGQSNQEETAWSEVEGFVVLRSHAGSKTDTPIIETPQAISVVNSDLIESRGADTVSQSLRYSAGVNPFAHFDRTSDLYSIRGIESNNGIFLDGTQHRVNRFDSVIEPFGVERLEVIKGPSSVLYGANSPGGLINGVSKQPLGKEHGEVGLTFGSHQRQQAKADIGGSFTEQLDYRLVALLRDSETQVDHIDDNRQYIAPSVTWQASEKTSLTLLSYYQQDETDFAFGLPRAGTLVSGTQGKFDEDTFIGEPSFNGTERTHYSVGYMLDHKFNNDFSFRQNVRYFDSTADRNEMWDTNILAVAYDPGQTGILFRIPLAREQTSDSLTLDNQFQYQINGDLIQHKLLAGIDYRQTHFEQEISTDLGVLSNPTKYALNLYNPTYGLTPVEANTVYSTEDSESRQVGVYLQDQMTINDNVIATVAGRQDYADNKVVNGSFDTTTLSLEQQSAVRSHDKEFSSRLGLTYLSETGLAPYYNYSESFLPQLGMNSNGKSLKPEKGQQHELGIKYQPAQFNSFITLALFDLVRENVVSQNAAGTEVNQIGEVHSKGAELEASASFDNGLNATLAYARTEARIKKSLLDYQVDLTPERIPEDSTSLWLDYRPQIAALQGLSMGLGGRYIGRTYDQTNQVSIPSYTVFDASASYRINNWSLSLNATNMFDRNYIAQCTSSVNNTNGQPLITDCSRGQERQLNLTASYQWGS